MRNRLARASVFLNRRVFIPTPYHFPMLTGEITFLLGLLLLFYFTILHPFIVGFFIAILTIHAKYFAKKLDLSGANPEFTNSKKTALAFYSNSSHKQRNEDLPDNEVTEPRNKYSRLLLTYQVPNMTEHYESLIGLIHQ
uniref:PRA1 family protein n=1 Tax=Heterorhabditis bacteriophora TaxID=37862 RepID=A0A1I7WRD8_HETBA